MRYWLYALALAMPPAGVAGDGPFTALENSVAESLQAGPIYRNYDRPGSDYRNFDLSRQSYQLCEDACALDTRCKAWTYVRAGIQGPKARCWLKWRVPPGRYNTCCTSGVK